MQKENSNTNKIDTKNEPEIKRLKLPKICYILYLCAAVSLIIYIIAMNSAAFADFFSRRISSIFRAILAYCTNLIPFSLAESLLLFLPVAAVVIIIYAIRTHADSWHNSFVFIGKLFCFICVLFTLFVTTFGTGYYTTPLADRLSLNRQDISADDLEFTAAYLISKMNEESDKFYYDKNGSSVMPYSYYELSEKLVVAYDKICDEYNFIQRLSSYVKPVAMSVPMSYTHITGVYTYFTGEANINVDFPDYTIPFTAAHEMAHQRGIAREDEANFVAFLVCIASDDPYIRYSGYLNMYEYLASPLKSADSIAYSIETSKIDVKIIGEMIAYNNFFEKYEKSTASVISGKINDTYLQSQGTPGSVSYGMVVELAVAYIKELPQ